ncbi:MAG TPA: hypothetical protein VJ755_11800, partial [Gemmatimonadales bacterium]|nr:hypothetical protein [Gemmatimonadales bacterium]
VRVWRTDSTAHIQLSQPGHLVVLYADPIGRLAILFPSAPWDSTAVSADVPVTIDLPPEAQGNPATFVAVRTRWRFDFDALRSGIEWNYDALLLQPTAGDPLAALLDIADRITHGRPYDHGVVTYARDGSVLARGPVQMPDVCLGCVRSAPVAAPAVAAATNSVDCSNASLTNAFCGVNSGSVSFATAPSAPPQVIYQPAPVTYTYYPLYPGTFFSQSRSRFDRPIQTMRPATPSAFSIAPRLVSPSPRVLGRGR